MRWTRIERRRAAGLAREAEAAAAVARARLDALSAKIADPELRRRFRTDVEEHRAILSP